VTLINPSIGNSSYHGGFIRTEKRFGAGRSFLAHYTFSKFLDDVEAANEFNGTPASYMDAYNRRLDKGLSGSDVPHRLVVTLLYEVPRFHGGRLINGAFGGWKLGVLQTLESGPSFTVMMTSNTTNAFSAGPLRPNLLRDASLGSERTINRWFDPAAFSVPVQFAFGNSPRNGLRSAPIQTTDVTLEKSFRITERWRVDVRGELYNLLNHANFDIPGHTFGAADFGVVSSARPARTAQLALRVRF
jgi:hypothetical protein